MVKSMKTAAYHGIRFHQAAVEGDLAGVHAVVDHPDAEEEGAGDHPVAQHLEERALLALNIAGEDGHGHEAHVGDRRIGESASLKSVCRNATREV